MSYIAFFDLDKTILKVNSGKVLFKKAGKEGVLTKRKLFFAYGLAILNTMKLIAPARIIERFPSWLTGIGKSSFERFCQGIVEKDLIPLIRPQIIEEINNHKKAGAKLVMLSATIGPLCWPIAKHLEMDDVLCSELEVENEKYTGLSVGKLCFGMEKLHRMEQYLATVQMSSEDAYYYGDSIHDVHVLESVGHPVCVNPDRALSRKASKQKWVVFEWD